MRKAPAKASPKQKKLKSNQCPHCLRVLVGERVDRHATRCPKNPANARRP
jgi:hypothetical protein